MRQKLTTLAIAVLLAATGCGDYDRPPATPSFLDQPETTALNGTTLAKVYSDAPTGKFITYLVDWGDGAVETTATYVAGDTAEQWHTWHTAGTFTSRARAWYTFDTTKYSDWSAGETIIVTP